MSARGSVRGMSVAEIDAVLGTFEGHCYAGPVEEVLDAPREDGPTLEALCDRILLDRMPGSLRGLLDDLVSHGASAPAVLDHMGPKHRSTYLQAWAYLDRKGVGR